MGLVGGLEFFSLFLFVDDSAFFCNHMRPHLCIIREDYEQLSDRSGLECCVYPVFQRKKKRFRAGCDLMQPQFYQSMLPTINVKNQKATKPLQVVSFN